MASASRELSPEEVLRILEDYEIDPPANEGSSDSEFESDSDLDYNPNSSDNSSNSSSDSEDQDMNQELLQLLEERHTELPWQFEPNLIPPFPFTGNPGILNFPDNNENILDYFKLFLDDDLFSNICVETNRYAAQLKQSLEQNNRLRHQSRINKWTNITLSELFTFISIIIMMGIIKKPSIASYWTQNFLFNTPSFPSIMSRNRFQLIRSCLHFSNNITADPNDKLAKIRPIVDNCVEKFQSVYKPNSTIVIDEILQLWKGRLGWKQYIPAKRSRFGIKFFMLCESQSSYIYNFIIYTGQGTDFKLQNSIQGLNQQDLAQSSNIVLKLTENLLNLGYTIVCDNFYNSPDLCKILNNLKTDIFGTLRVSRKGVPMEVKEANPKKGDLIFMQSDKTVIFKWRDPQKKKKKIVSLISTIHDDLISPTGKLTPDGDPIMKPQVIIDYNKTMGAVDKVSQITDPYSTTRKGLKWFRKLFECLIDMCILNSYLIFCKINHETKITHLQFKIKLVEKILEKHHYGVYQQRRRAPETPARLVDRHFISSILPNPVKKNPSRRCLVCSKRKIRKDSRFECKLCGGVCLCIEPCFEIYHTINDYERIIEEPSSD